MDTGIYKIVCEANQSFYIGSATNLKGRWRTHLSSLKYERHFNVRLQRCYNKYGKNSFSFEVLEKCLIEQLQEREQHWIDLHFNDSLCLNLNPNARTSHNAGGTLPEETKKKITASLLKRYKDPLYRKKVADSHRGKKMPPRDSEWSRKQSLAQTGMKHPNWNPQSSIELQQIPYSFISPEGQLFEGKNIKQFARDHNLNYDCMNKLMRGQRQSHKGWVKA